MTASCPAMPDPGQLVATMPFAANLGIEIDAASVEEGVGRMAWAPERCTAGGVLHGGALMSMADRFGGAFAVLNLPPGAGAATISSSTNMTRAVRKGEVTGTS